jgi:DNA-binding SARP family transcriptional activator
VTEPGRDLDLRLLGPVRVRRAGVEVVSGADRRAAVLGVLALRANRPVSREELVTAVWGGDPPVSALGNIYTSVSELRSALGQVLSSAAGSYLLRVPDSAVDVWRFEKAREISRAAGDKAAELAALEDALGLWQGEALAGVPGPFAAAQRARLTELRLADVERHAGLLLDLGRHEEAIAALRELVEAYPLQERFHGLLMTTLHACGRGAAALTTYRDARRLLAQLTGNEPGPVLQEAHRTVIGDARPVPRKPVLVGRGTEVLLLRHAATQVAAGSGGHIRLEGPPGIGKSAVLAAGLRTSRPAGCRIGWSKGGAGASPLATLLDCLRSATGEQLDWPPDPADQAEQVMAAVTEACAESPLILVVDDLHQADDATLRIWPFLQQLTARLPLFLAAAARPDRPRLGPLGWSGAMPLGPLASAEATALVEAMAERPLAADRIERIVTDAGGNPCYLLAGAEAADPPGEGIPAELMTAVTRHLAVLGEPARHVLRAIAFLGDDCDIAQLATATAKPPESLLGAVAEARAAGFLSESADTMTFRHAIVARVLHDGTPNALRIMLHRSFAEQLARAGMAPRQVIAQLIAGPVPLDAEMSAWLVSNVEVAAERSPRETVNILQLAHQQPGLRPETRLQLTAWLARLLFRLDLPVAQPAGWVAARSTDTAVEAEMRWMVALAHERRGESAKAAEVARWVLSARKAPEDWLDRFRELLARIRPRMGGLPTRPHEPTETGYQLDLTKPR